MVPVLFAVLFLWCEPRMFSNFVKLLYCERFFLHATQAGCVMPSKDRPKHKPLIIMARLQLCLCLAVVLLVVTAAAGTQDKTNNNEDSGGGGGMVFRLLCKYLSVGCADEELGRAIVEGESGRVKELLDSGAANALAVHQVPENTTSNGDTCVSDKNKSCIGCTFARSCAFPCCLLQ